jgi:hypothetical protein
MRGYRIPKQEFLWSEIDHDQCFKMTPLFMTGLLYGLYIRIELRRDDESEDTTVIGHKTHYWILPPPLDKACRWTRCMMKAACRLSD